MIWRPNLWSKGVWYAMRRTRTLDRTARATIATQNFPQMILCLDVTVTRRGSANDIPRQGRPILYSRTVSDSTYLRLREGRGIGLCMPAPHHQSNELCTEAPAKQRSEGLDDAVFPMSRFLSLGLAHPSLTPDHSSHKPTRSTRTHHRVPRLRHLVCR